MFDRSYYQYMDMFYFQVFRTMTVSGIIIKLEVSIFYSKEDVVCQNIAYACTLLVQLR